jgi:hypothetical protein
MNAAIAAANKHNATQYLTRYGCIAARIGSNHMVKLKVDWTSPQGRTIRKGINVQLACEDITRHPDLTTAPGLVKWHCVYCRQDWDTKEELVASHPDNRILAKQNETHLYYATAQRAASPGKPAKHDDKGKVIAEAVDPVESCAVLLSDEE